MISKERYKVSCNICRRKKIKCDRAFPSCSSCSRSGIECTYSDSFRNTPISKPKKIDSGKRISKVEVLKLKPGKKDLYYGSNSTESLVKVIQGEKINQDEPHKFSKVHHLPRISESTALNKRLIISIIKTLVESSFYGFYQSFFDISKIFRKVDECEETLEASDVLLVCSLLLVCSNIDEVLDQKKIQEIESLYLEVSDKAPISIEKIKSQLFFFDYLHYKAHSNSAYQVLFSAVSGAYALGLHLDGSAIWIAILFFDVLICSTLGRPTAIHKSYLLSHKKESNLSLKIFPDVIELLRQSNSYLTSTGEELDYELARSLDSKFDELRQIVKTNIGLVKEGKEILNSLFVLLTCNQLKLHYIHESQKDYSSFKMEDLFCCLFSFIELFLQNLYGQLSSRFNRYEAEISYFGLRSHFACLICFTNQAILILLTYITRRKKVIPLVHDFIKNILSIARETENLIVYDKRTLRYLNFVDEKMTNFNSNSESLEYEYDSKDFAQLDIDNPYFFHSANFLSLLFPEILE